MLSSTTDGAPSIAAQSSVCVNLQNKCDIKNPHVLLVFTHSQTCSVLHRQFLIENWNPCEEMQACKHYISVRAGTGTSPAVQVIILNYGCSVKQISAI